MSGPRADAFAALLGIEVERRGAGHTVAVLATDERHANPHGTVHGAVFYAVAGAAVAAAANDAESSGIISSVLVEYLQPAALGDELYAEVDAHGVDRAGGHLHRVGAPWRRRRSAGLGTGPRHAPNPHHLILHRPWRPVRPRSHGRICGNHVLDAIAQRPQSGSVQQRQS